MITELVVLPTPGSLLLQLHTSSRAKEKEGWRVSGLALGRPEGHLLPSAMHWHNPAPDVKEPVIPRSEGGERWQRLWCKTVQVAGVAPAPEADARKELGGLEGWSSCRCYACAAGPVLAWGCRQGRQWGGLCLRPPGRTASRSTRTQECCPCLGVGPARLAH